MKYIFGSLVSLLFLFVMTAVWFDIAPEPHIAIVLFCVRGFVITATILCLMLLWITITE